MLLLSLVHYHYHFGTTMEVSMYELTPDSLRRLTECIRAAYREECESGECQCITTEEHERRLGSITTEERKNMGTKFDIQPSLC